MSLSNKNLTQINATADLNDMELRVLRATMNGKPAANPMLLSNAVKSVADEMGVEREEALQMLKAYVENELAAENAMVAKNWQSSVHSNIAIHADSTRH